MSPDFARRAVLGMWLGALGVVFYREWGNPRNPGRPLPRPCKLIPPSIGYTGLGLLAELVPMVAFLVALGLTVAEVVAAAQREAEAGGIPQTIFDQVAASIGRENRAVAAAG